MILKPIADRLRNRSNARPKTDPVAETAARLEQRILALVEHMPALPDTATRALALAREPESKFADFARLIEADAALATGILRIANSPLYASKLPDTLIEAIRFHHEPHRAENAKRLVELVAAADHMANHMQRGEAIEAYHPEDNVGLTSLWASWPEARKERLLGDIPSMMKESVEAFLREHPAD